MDLQIIKHSMRMRMRMRNPENSPRLPGKIIADILLRLPFDSILRCKLVSKEWKKMINDPTFYKHYQDNNSTALFMGRGSVYSLRIRHDQCPKSSLHRAQNPNGLKSTIVLPMPLPWICYGYGYDGHDDDYKILVVCPYEARHRYRYGYGEAFDTSSAQNKDNTLYWVYSFRKQVWERFNGFPYSAYDWMGRPAATTINGVLHWPVPNQGKEEVIVTYDLHSGRFGEMRVPNVINALSHYDVHTYLIDVDVAELNGRLCNVYKTEFLNTKPKLRCNYRIDVWVMKEYGVGDSWAKLVSIDCSRLPRIPWEDNWRLTPLVLHDCEDGRVLMLLVCPTVLFWYDVLDDKFETFSNNAWPKQRIQLKRKTRV